VISLGVDEKGRSDLVNRKAGFVIGILFTGFVDDHGKSVVIGVLESWSIEVMERFAHRQSRSFSTTPSLHYSKNGRK
jgi:hypothetical protein